MSPGKAPRTFVIGNLTIDHTVLPGVQHEEVVYAGNALYAALGCSLWVESVSVVSCLGHDYQRSLIVVLESLGIDTHWISEHNVPNLRGRLTYDDLGRRDWHALDGDGNLAQDSVSDASARHRSLSPRPTPELVDALGRADGVHIAPMPSDLQRAFLVALWNCSTYITLDPHPTLMQELALGPVPEIARANAFLPSLAEAAVLAGIREEPNVPCDAVEVARSLCRLGATVVGIKLGSNGVAVFDSDTGDGFHVPAKSASVVDPTGAGDSFCGAWLAAASGGESVRLAAERGAITAARTVAALGPSALVNSQTPHADYAIQPRR